MEIEKAVETLNVMEGQYAHIRHSDAEFEAIEQAKDALRAQQEREKGCQFCAGRPGELKRAAERWNTHGIKRDCTVTTTASMRKPVGEALPTMSWKARIWINCLTKLTARGLCV